MYLPYRSRFLSARVRVEVTGGFARVASLTRSISMNDIEKLDALGREYGLVIYAIHQARAGWGCQWYDGIADLTATPNEWQKHLSVYGYYPTIAEMVKAETERIKGLAAAKQSMPIPAYPV